MSIKPNGKIRVPYKVERPSEITLEYLDTLTLSEAIPYLREFPINEGETFPWVLVERFIKDADNKDISAPDDLPKPQEGFAWRYVSSMAKLSGVGGWLEVDEQNKRQGKFIMVCRS